MSALAQVSNQERIEPVTINLSPNQSCTQFDITMRNTTAVALQVLFQKDENGAVILTAERSDGSGPRCSYIVPKEHLSWDPTCNIIVKPIQLEERYLTNRREQLLEQGFPSDQIEKQIIPAMKRQAEKALHFNVYLRRF